MAGYDHQVGMSINAIDAYGRGVKPISRITLSDLREAGLEITLGFARWLAQRGHWQSCEWHHSGGTWYNEVDFYDPRDLAEAVAGGKIDLEELEATYRRSLNAKPESRRVTGRYPIWGGARQRPRITGYQNFTGTLTGDWIALDGGGRKKATGKNISWRYV